MKRTWTIIGVQDVPRSYTWYQSLFGQPLTAPAHSYFGSLLDSDGTVLLCLHEWAVEDHPSLMRPDDGVPGNGLLLFFRVDDYDAALRRARALVPQLTEESHLNPNTQTNEFSLRDPDGYYVTISALSAAETQERATPGVVQFEFSVPDPEQAAAFYSAVFGWSITKLPDPIAYWQIRTADAPAQGAIPGGIVQSKTGAPRVTVTIQVPSVGEAGAGVTAHGGSLVTDPQTIPGYGVHVLCRDPQGNFFALLEPVSTG